MHNEDIRLAEEAIGYPGTRDLEPIIVSEHSIERYVERFKGITDKATQGVYVVQNRDEIEDFIKRTFQYADLVYIGNLGKANKADHYFLNRDIALIYDPHNKCIVTIFRIKFDVPEQELSEAIIDSYKKSIIIKQEELFELTQEYKDVQVVTNGTVEQNNIRIAELEEQIKLLQSENAVHEQQLSVVNGKINVTKQSIKGLAGKLFGMSDFKLL